MELRGRTAVVTGAASGIGRALAERFATEGMRVVLADLDEAALAAAEAALRARGAEVLAVATDVSRGPSVDALAARARQAFGPVHLLCNNAGVGGVGGPVWTLTEKDWEWTLGVNLWGVIHGVRAFVPTMIADGEPAHVVNTASIAGLLTPAFVGAYAASKHAVVALSEVLARDLQAAAAPVAVSVLCPAFVRTNIADSERSRPSALANATDGAASPLAGARAMMDRSVRALVAAGMAPETVAEHVVDAVRAGRFYVLPHGEMVAAVRERLEGIVENRTPTFDPRVFGPGPRRG